MLQLQLSGGGGGPPDLGLGPANQGPPAPTCPQDDSDGSIECVNEERKLHRKVCNVSYPFFRAKAKVEAKGSMGGARVGTGSEPRGQQGRDERTEGGFKVC